MTLEVELPGQEREHVSPADVAEAAQTAPEWDGVPDADGNLITVGAWDLAPDGVSDGQGGVLLDWAGLSTSAPMQPNTITSYPAPQKKWTTLSDVMKEKEAEIERAMKESILDVLTKERDEVIKKQAELGYQLGKKMNEQAERAKADGETFTVKLKAQNLSEFIERAKGIDKLFQREAFVSPPSDFDPETQELTVDDIDWRQLQGVSELRVKRNSMVQATLMGIPLYARKTQAYWTGEREAVTLWESRDGRLRVQASGEVVRALELDYNGLDGGMRIETVQSMGGPQLVRTEYRGGPPGGNFTRDVYGGDIRKPFKRETITGTAIDGRLAWKR